MVDSRLPTVQLQGFQGGKYLWENTREAFKYIYKNHLKDADWFIKADDENYVVIENLRYLLSQYNSSESIYFGAKVKHGPLVKLGFISGGAGYVLSREAVKRLVTEGLRSAKLCGRRAMTWTEGEAIARCLPGIGVMVLDSRDVFNRSRFFPSTPDYHIEKAWPDFWDPIKTGHECCSEYAISFHNVEPAMMYVLDYFIYHLKPIGNCFEFINKTKPAIEDIDLALVPLK